MISVVICTWNRCDILQVTLEHMTTMVVPPTLQWELLVVNNGGTDKTNEVCDSFKEQLPIRPIWEPTPGQSNARNTAIREAKGDYIAWTDDDVLVDRDWLTELEGAARQHSADFVFGSSDPKWPAVSPSWYSPAFRGNFAVLNYGPEAFVVSSQDQPFFGLNFAGSRDAHLRLNGFRADFGLKGTGGGVGEDVDLFQRALSAGMKIVYTPKAKVLHMIAPERIHKRYHRRRQWVALPKTYEHMQDLFSGVSWLFGLPRFFYGMAAKDALGYIGGLATFDRSVRFFHELRLLRFTGLVLQAGKHGFKTPTRIREASEVSRP